MPRRAGARACQIGLVRTVGPSPVSAAFRRRWYATAFIVRHWSEDNGREVRRDQGLLP